MGIRLRTRPLCIVLCAMWSLTANPSRATEWSMEPSLDLRTEYNDNINLTSAPHSRVWGVILSPEAKFSGTTESLNVTGGLRFNLNRYFGEQGLDTNDHILTLESTYTGERDVVGLNVASVRDSTLVSELAETGVVLARRQRNRLTANPSWSRSLTETMTVAATYSYNDVRYADTADTGLVDYRAHTATVGLQSRFGERDIGSVTAYYQRYETAQSRANTYGIQVAYDRALTETLHANLLLGTRTTHSDVFSQALVCDAPIVFGICTGNVTALTSTVSESSTGYVFAAAIDKRWETAAVSGRLSHEINPSGVGALVETDRLGLTLTQQWAPTVSSSVGAAVYQAGNIGSHVVGSKSRYYTIEPRVNWNITQWWTLSAGYSYQRVRYLDNPAEASANVAYIILSYKWPKLSVSR